VGDLRKPQRAAPAHVGRGDELLVPYPYLWLGAKVERVVDASVAVPACLAEAGFELLADDDLVAPALWLEARSVLNELVRRNEITVDDGEAARLALGSAPVRRVDDPRIGAGAWRIADAFGWAKTYDAGYVALAELLGCRMVTLDPRLWTRADALGVVVWIDDLALGLLRSNI
jgi:predicted nucleic acid-binding protein